MKSTFLTALVAVFLCLNFPVSVTHAEPSDVTNATPVSYSPANIGGSNVIAIARRSIGTNPTGQRLLWCMDFVNLVHDKAGLPTGTRSSSSALGLGERISRIEAQPGDLVWRSRGRRGGHVEFFAGWTDATKTQYRAVTGNTCGPRGRRAVCEVTRSASRMQRVVRVRS